MDQEVRIRGAAILCCHCVRNAAYYRAGRQNGVLLKRNDDFWVNLNSNFLDRAVMEWCKLFADNRGKHCWRKVVTDCDWFGTLLTQSQTTQAEFDD